MADKTGIEWTDASWNPIRGCSMAKGSETGGCLNCYAAAVAVRFSDPGLPYAGLAKRTPSGPRWTGRVEVVDHHLCDPLKWQKPRRIFVNSMSDLFHEALTDAQIDRVFAVMALAPQHTFQVLTKRPERMKRYLTSVTFGQSVISEPSAYKRVVAAMDMPEWLPAGRRFLRVPENWPLPNVWLGTSVENRDTLHRIDTLKDTPAAVHFVSLEPLLEDLGALLLDGIEWVIVGGESGPGARSCRPSWIRAIVQQCVRQHVPVFVKQLGTNILTRNDDGFMGEFGAENHREWPEHLAIEDRVEDNPHGYREEYQGADVRLHLRSRKGGDPGEWPLDLRVREFPRVPGAA